VVSFLVKVVLPLIGAALCAGVIIALASLVFYTVTGFLANLLLKLGLQPFNKKWGGTQNSEIGTDALIGVKDFIECNHKRFPRFCPLRFICYPGIYAHQTKGYTNQSREENAIDMVPKKLDYPTQDIAHLKENLTDD
jgi:hypothetical protein